MPTTAALKDPFLAERSDDELVDLARRTGNDDGAFEELYRRHENAARNVARHIVCSRHDADDVVNEAFAGVISAINHGAGPRSNFRQYLMACVRNSCKSRRWCGRSISTDPSLHERSGAIFEDPECLSEAGLVANAFSSLSPDWQQTLWLTAAEERPTSEVAQQLDRRPAAVAALAHRARAAFAEAYLAQHQARSTDPTCARISPKLAHYVRRRSGDVDSVLVERHLVDCVACSCAVDELRDLNASLRTLTGPAPLVGMDIAAAGAATMVGFLPLAGSSGWSVGSVSGSVVAKIAVLGALLVPAAIVAAKTSPTPVSREKIFTAAPSTPGRATVTGKVLTAVAAPPPTIVTLPVDPLLADMLSAANTGAVPGSPQSTAIPSSIVVPLSSVVTPLNTSALPLPALTTPAP
jgi:RNA polymerase sigma factor (sigma-70 family)